LSPSEPREQHGINGSDCDVVAPSAQSGAKPTRVNTARPALPLIPDCAIDAPDRPQRRGASSGLLLLSISSGPSATIKFVAATIGSA